MEKKRQNLDKKTEQIQKTEILNQVETLKQETYAKAKDYFDRLSSSEQDQIKELTFKLNPCLREYSFQPTTLELFYQDYIVNHFLDLDKNFLTLLKEKEEQRIIEIYASLCPLERA